MQNQTRIKNEALCKRNECSLRETVWCDKNHAVSHYSQEFLAKRCARCNKKGADVTSADIDLYWRTRTRQTLPLGTPMTAIKQQTEGRGFCVDTIGAGCSVYYIEENDFETHCLIFPGDYIKGNSSCENEPIDMWIISDNLIVRDDLPTRELRKI